MSVLMEEEKLSTQVEDEAYVARLREAIVVGRRQRANGQCVSGIDNVHRIIDQRRQELCNAQLLQ